jgi:hypothetical protein
MSNKRDEIKREIESMCWVIDTIYEEREWLMGAICCADKESNGYMRKKGQLDLINHLIKGYEG